MPLTNHTIIFGGSFDPIHFGHLTCCSWLLSTLNAERIVLAPTFEHCFGKKLTYFHHRVKMCQLLKDSMMLNYPYISVVNIEEKLPKPNITFNLINGIKELPLYKDKKLVIVIGSDLVPELHKWEKWDEVAAMVKVVAIGRSGFENAKTPLNIYQYPIELSAISSSMVRDKIAKGESITGLVPHNIKEYIYENGLYK